ncbi:hypothetical protein [Microbacterium invictum]|uniref:Uncharacterized protein n=1 Tax=Microbacterium invictum TaxID=515415 RepID=A0AA40SPQ9_9MICO|nr:MULTISPECIES: hypothetical protein [Microbacterium]MBB4140158.1 hypothetical protein [Microbacterium invictum]
MARVGGRNAIFAWIVGLVCAAVVVGLGVLALPMLPATVGWMAQQAGDRPPGATTADDELDPTDPVECRDLYVDALWSALVWTDESVLTPSTDAPTTTATPVVEALSPVVRMTCSWKSDKGEIHTTVATVATDAGAIATAALPGLGFACTEQEARVRCVRTEEELTETIETGGGLWLSTSQNAWYPVDYHRRVADRVFVVDETPGEADAESS